MPDIERLRIVTYNVHRCVGTDRRLAPARIVEVIESLQPDVIALQELDVNRPRTNRVDQAGWIADKLGMRRHFFPAHEHRDEHFGNAVLTRLPMRLMRAGHLPHLPGKLHRERRAALWLAIEWTGVEVHFITAHLGLRPLERVLQAEALTGSEWLRHPDCKTPVIVCGDFNALPRTRAYRRMRTWLTDPFRWTGWPPGTFPSSYPVLRIDHVFLSNGWKVHSMEAVRNRLTRVASDHLPLVVEASLS